MKAADMNFTIKEPMPPVWMMHPHISRCSIGWRMGYGEWYKDDFWNWFDSLTDSGKELYEEMFPAPPLWRGIYDENGDSEDSGYYSYETVQLWNKNGEYRYSRKKLKNEYGAGKRNEFVFFWKPRDGAVHESCLGQWQPSAFTVDTDEYNCAEQYMMAEKARLFDDGETRALIMKSLDPKEMKALGKKVRNFDQATWDRVKYSIVLNGNYYKFSQNEDMRNYLLSTGNKILVEASPLDTVWGIGLGRENEKAYNPHTWRGENLLGFALMEVRDETGNVYKNYDRVNWKEILKKYSE